MMRNVLVIALSVTTVFGCTDETDCSLNGKCIDRICFCEAAWTGPRCEVLVRLPVDVTTGFDSPYNGGRSSSWGGSVVEVNGTFHMYSAEMVNECGIEFWEPNSQVVHAVSQSPEGPYTFKDVVSVPFAHEPNAVLAPTGEIVIYMTMRHPDGYVPANCSAPQPTPVPTPKPIGPTPTPTPAPCYSPPPRHTYMTYAKDPSGPWSDPVLVLKANHSKWANCPVLIDTNLAMAIKSDGSAVGVWRKCTNMETGKCSADCCTFPHLLKAGDWRDPASYVPNSDTPMFPELDPFGSEDPFVWLDETHPGGVHAILHDEQGPTRSSANGMHAFSADGGDTWTYGKDFAYNGTVQTNDGRTILYSRRERPHMILNSAGEVTHVTNGVQEEATPTDCDMYAQCDRSYTLVQKLGHKKEQ